MFLSRFFWMGYLSWSVPIMSYALVTGSSYAMVGAISLMDSAGKSAASTGGAAAATGNVNQGNVGMNNYNANKHDAAVTDVTGIAPRVNYDGFNKREASNSGMRKLTDTATGAYAAMQNGSYDPEAAGSNMIDGSINKSNVATQSKAYSQAKSNLQQDGQSLNSSYQTTVGSYNGLSSADKTAVNKDWNLSNKKSVSNAADYAHLSEGQMTDSNGMSLEAYMQTQAGISALGDKGVAGLKLNLEHKFGMSQKQADTFTSKYQADQVQGLNNSLSKSHSTSIGKDSGFKNSVNDSLTATQNYSNAESKVKTAQTQLTAAESVTSQMTAKAMPGFLTQYNKKHGLVGGKGAKSADVHLQNQMGEGNKKALAAYNNYLISHGKTPQALSKIKKEAGGISTKNIKPQVPVNSFNKNKPAAGKLWTPYPMIKTPDKKQRNLDINKNIQNAALLKNKALNYGSLTHKLGLGSEPPAINPNLGQTILGYHPSGNTRLVAKTPGGIKGQEIFGKYGTPEFKYKMPNGQTRVAPISGGKGPGDPETFIGKNGTIHTLEDDHFGSGGGVK